MKIKQWPLYVMLIPSMVFLVVFMYAPIYGLILIFKRFTISGGIWGSPWIEPLTANFWWLKDAEFWNVFKNTIRIATIKFLTGFPAPIILALLINELRVGRFKKGVQTILYLPHFISWVIFAGIVYRLLGGDADSPINLLLGLLGIQPVNLLADEGSFLWVIVGTALIKDVGWGTIIYLAAISGADPQLYDAASLDGCGQWAKARYVTLPTILPIVSIMAILSIPSILSAGFDQIYNLSNAMVARTANILDIYIVKVGIFGGQYSHGIAVNFFLKVASLGLVLVANRISKQGFGYGIF